MTTVEYQILLRDRFSRPMAGVNNQLGTFNRKMAVANVNGKRMSGGMQSMGAMAGKMGRMLGTFGLALGVGQLGSSIVRLGVDMEQTKVSFETMLGSAEKASKLVDDINQFANVTPFENDQLFENAKLLMNFGMEGEKVIPTMRMIGDISGGNAGKFQMLSLAYSQARSAGKLMGQDLMQMINAGFNPLQELARTSGKSIGYWKEQMSKGNVTVKELDQAFQSATAEGGRFYKMMEKQSKTLAGRWSTFMGKLKMIGIEIGTKLLPILGKVVDGLMKFMESAKKNFHYIKTAVQPVIDQFKRLRDSVSNLLSKFIDKSKPASERWQKFAETLKISLVPLRMVLHAIRKIVDWVSIGVSWFQKMYDKYEGLRKVIKALLDPFRKLIEAFEWVNRQLNQSERMDKINDLRKRADEIKNRLNTEMLTMAKRNELEKEYLRLIGEASKLAGQNMDRQFSWVAGMNKNINEIAGDDGIGGTTGGTGGAGGEGVGTPEINKITGAAPKVFNLNVTKLIEGDLVVNSQTLSEGADQIKDTLLQTLLEMLADVQTNVG